MNFSAAEICVNLCPIANYRGISSSGFTPLTTVDHLKIFTGDVGSSYSKLIPPDKRFTSPITICRYLNGVHSI